MRRREPPPRSSTGRGEPPPLELLRCPATRWNAGPTPAAAFEEWLRERQAWRETHDAPLPGLFARDRYALHQMTDRVDTARVPQLWAGLVTWICGVTCGNVRRRGDGSCH